jgi:membrane associated rhomboid family serine protease
VADEERERGPLYRRWATWALVALNSSVFLAMVLAGASPLYVAGGDAVAAGAVDPVRVWSGEVWRLLMACFVHLGIWHLALNMWVLLQLGRALEEMIGGARFLLVYLSSGVFGFAASLAVRGSPTAGASGAVFGVTGGLLALALLLRHRQLGRLLFRALLPFVVATILLGVLVRMVDNSAHVGGLLFGFLLTWGLSAGDRQLLDPGGGPGVANRDARGGPRERRLGALALIGSAAIFLAVVAYSARPVLSPRYQVKSGLEALLGKRVDEARERARAAARIAPDDGVTFALLARIREETATNDEERAEASRLMLEAMRRFGDARAGQEPEKALLTAQVELGVLGGGTEDLPFNDTRTVNALCEAALELQRTEGTAPAPVLKNECAWLKLRAPDPSVKAPGAALILAREAVHESEGKDASILHTLAEAHAQTGDPAEGLAILEKLSAEGRGKELPGGADFLRAERHRLKRMLDDATPDPEAPAPPTAAAGDQGPAPAGDLARDGVPLPPIGRGDAAPDPALGLP